MKTKHNSKSYEMRRAVPRRKSVSGEPCRGPSRFADSQRALRFGTAELGITSRPARPATGGACEESDQV